MHDPLWAEAAAVFRQPHTLKWPALVRAQGIQDLRGQLWAGQHRTAPPEVDAVALGVQPYKTLISCAQAELNERFSVLRAALAPD